MGATLTHCRHVSRLQIRDVFFDGLVKLETPFFRGGVINYFALFVRLSTVVSNSTTAFSRRDEAITYL